MKPLNRPMFRYGGPIKEGVMSGIREPKKDGGSMDINKPKRGLVNEPGSYAGFLALSPYVGAGLTALRVGAQRAIPKIANFFRTKTGEIGAGTAKVRTLPPMTAGRNLPKNIKIVPKQGPGQPIYEPNYLGRDPLVRAAGGLYNTVTSPTAKGIGAKAVRFATSPSSIIAGTAYYLWPDGKERTTPPPLGDSGRVGTSGAPGGGDPGMYLTPQGDKSKKGGGVELSAEELRKKNVERYRDIMDIKGMNKDAAYKSLISASQLINQSGDFKGDIKSGKLINEIIQATSKNFDKPKATKDAIDTLILKGEIEKDLNKEKNALENKKTNLQIKVAEKSLAGDSFDEAILKKITSTSGKMPTGSDLAGILKATRGIDSVVLDGSQVTPGGEVKFLQESVNEKIKEGTSVNPGAYVLNSKILIVDEQGNVSQYY